MFEWESEDGELHHYRVELEAKLFDCARADASFIPEPCMGGRDPSVTEPAPVQNVNGESLFSYISNLFNKPQDFSDVESDRCQMVHQFHYQQDLSNRFVFGALGIILTSIVSVIILVCVFKLAAKKFSRIRKRTTNESASTANDDKLSIEPTHISEPLSVSEQPPPDTKPKVTEPYAGIPLSYQQIYSSDYQSQIKVKTLGTAEFLQNATDKLYAELDKLLLKNVNDRSTAQLALSTPRLPRRADHRGRIGSSPSLSRTDQSVTSYDGSNVETKEKTEAWKELKIFSREMGWLEPMHMNIDETKLDRSGQRLLHYFHRVCPIIPDQWESSVLITNFALILLNKQLQELKSSVGYRCVRLKSTGSAQLGHKVCKPNQYDVFMEIQPPYDIVPNAVIEQANTECIPPGRLLLCCKLRERSVHISSTSMSKSGKKIQLEGCIPQYCLSSKEMACSAEELVETSIQTLYSKYRSLIDRLPFQLKRAVVPNLVLSLDTKNLVGIGIPEIKINITPVIKLPFEGYYQPVKIYATPLMEMHEYKQRQETSNVICPDYLWQVAFGDFNEMFQRNVTDRVNDAGTNSCHILCLMVLKALLTGGVKTSLLDRGEYQTLHISTVLNFLILESQPEQWGYDQLVSRFSDCVHFLRDSFTNGRLPNFFINNPHIIEKMPLVRHMPLLMRKRQENLLGDMRAEALEKCVRFLEESLRDSGLAECVKDEYSHDMWEYEFFVFN